MNVAPDKLMKTVDEYNQAAMGRKKDSIGLAENAQPLFGPPFYIGKERIGVHATLGGIMVNELTQVLDTDGEIVEGIFAVGEVAAGVHGIDKMAGTGMTANFVFGRIAGAMAAKYVFDHAG